MMTIRFCLTALLFLTPSLVFAQDNIAGMTDPARDYSVEGDVVTVWENSFLLNDGSGSIIVDVSPFTTYDKDIKGRDYVQVTGHLGPNGKGMKPLLISRSGKDPVAFYGLDDGTQPEIPASLVQKNSQRYAMPVVVKSSGNNSSASTEAAAASSASPSGRKELTDEEIKQVQKNAYNAAVQSVTSSQKATSDYLRDAAKRINNKSVVPYDSTSKTSTSTSGNVKAAAPAAPVK